MRTLAIAIFILVVFVACNSSPSKSRVPLKKDPSYYTAIDSHLQFSPITMNPMAQYWDYMHKTYHYSGVSLVYKNDSFFIWYGGQADSSKALKPEMPMQIASLSKPFCAVAIFILIQKGQLKLSDSLRHFFPELPYYNVTIEQLLSHGSGIPEYVFFADQHWADSLGKLTNTGVISLLAKEKPAFWYPPGKKHHYCNTNFVLLASIIEKVSKKSYAEYIKENIFTPLGMQHSRVLPINFSTRDLSVQGHYGTGQPYPDDYQDGTFGDKNIESSVFDLLRFYFALRDNKILNIRWRNEMFRTRYFHARGFTEYALGWRKRSNDRGDWIFHTGWWHGFRSNFYFSLEKNECIVTLSNRLSGGFIPSGFITHFTQPAATDSLFQILTGKNKLAEDE